MNGDVPKQRPFSSLFHSQGEQGLYADHVFPCLKCPVLLCNLENFKLNLLSAPGPVVFLWLVIFCVSFWFLVFCFVLPKKSENKHYDLCVIYRSLWQLFLSAVEQNFLPIVIIFNYEYISTETEQKAVDKKKYFTLNHRVNCMCWHTHDFCMCSVCSIHWVSIYSTYYRDEVKFLHVTISWFLVCLFCIVDR